MIDEPKLWHPSGWSPVYDGTKSGRPLLGFTTLRQPVERFALTRQPASPNPDGVFVPDGEAWRVLLDKYYGRVVIEGDWREMPDFWPF